MPFAKSSVRLGRMTRTGSTRFFPRTRLKSCRGGGEVYSRPSALHAQFAEVQAKDELSGTAPAGNARKELRGRYRRGTHRQRGEIGATRWSRCADGACRGSTEAEPPVTLHPFPRPETADFCPVAQLLRPGELQCEWTMLAPNEAVIRHWQTMARAIHAGRVVHARICFRKTENRADYSATILEEDGNLWNQVQRYIVIYRR